MADGRGWRRLFKDKCSDVGDPCGNHPPPAEETCARADVAADWKWTRADCSAALLSVGVQPALSTVQLCIMFLAPKLNRAQAHFICETQTQMISEPPEVFVRKWISTGCLVNTRGESYEILTEQLG